MFVQVPNDYDKLMTESLHSALSSILCVREHVSVKSMKFINVCVRIWILWANEHNKKRKWSTKSQNKIAMAYKNRMEERNRQLLRWRFKLWIESDSKQRNANC